MRYLATAIAYVASLWVVGMAAIFWILGISGPESAPVSRAFEMTSYVVCGASVLIFPVLVAKHFWTRTKRIH